MRIGNTCNHVTNWGNNLFYSTSLMSPQNLCTLLTASLRYIPDYRYVFYKTEDFWVRLTNRVMALSWWTIVYLGVLGEVFLKSLGSAGVLEVVQRDLPLGAAQLQQKIFLSMIVQKKPSDFYPFGLKKQAKNSWRGTGRYCTVSVMKNV